MSRGGNMIDIDNIHLCATFREEYATLSRDIDGMIEELRLARAVVSAARDTAEGKWKDGDVPRRLRKELAAYDACIGEKP
jgi:hypothetical protein